MIEVAEELFGPYLWERYDILVLPAAFPFGGMENPRLTFATPTIIAGDRSLTALVAHELAHSWSGNLVTNATWDDFWLNEGFTVYEERRIMEELHGADYVAMLAALVRQDRKAPGAQHLHDEGGAGARHARHDGHRRRVVRGAQRTQRHLTHRKSPFARAGVRPYLHMRCACAADRAVEGPPAARSAMYDARPRRRWNGYG